MRHALWIPLLILSGCAPGRSYNPEKDRPKISIPESFGTGSPEKVKDGWIGSFGDNKLTSIVLEAMKANPDIQVSAAKLESAAASARKAGALLEPSLSVGFGEYAEGNKLASSRSHGVSLELSWELDIWGRIASGAEGARQQYLSAKLLHEYARQSLTAQVAKSWFQLLETQLQSDLLQESLSISKKTLKITEAKLKFGEADKQDVHLAKAQVASAEEALRKAKGSYDEAVRSLEFLLGRYPSAELKVTDRFGSVPPPIPVGLPSELLERRMDILAAERRVAAAFEHLSAAKAARLPTVALTGSGGSGSTDLSSILNPENLVWSVAGNLLAPILDGGRRKADVEIATAEQKAALAEYKGAALKAFLEVETALANEKLLREREGFLDVVVSENSKAYAIARSKFDEGETDVLPVLEVQSRVLNAKSARISIRSRRLLARVNLHLSLGGNFSTTK